MPNARPLTKPPSTLPLPTNVATSLQSSARCPHDHHHPHQPPIQPARQRRQKAANHGPVFITNWGKPAHVLLCIDDYRKLTGDQMTLGEALAQYAVPDFDFEAPRVNGLTRPADLS